MKKLLFSAVVAIPALVGLTYLAYAPQAEAAPPPYYCEWDYYSDSTYAEYVGWKVLTCSGRTYRSGTETPYSIQVVCSPCNQ
jgi:hypothetical protein